MAFYLPPVGLRFYFPCRTRQGNDRVRTGNDAIGPWASTGGGGDEKKFVKTRSRKIN